MWEACLNNLVNWVSSQLNGLSQLNADQKTALAGVVISGVAGVATLFATRYAFVAAREGRKAVEVARDASREQRAVRRYERLQLLLTPVANLQRAAATAEASAGETQQVGDARAILEDLAKPFTAAELPHLYTVLGLDQAQLSKTIVECEAATKEVNEHLEAARETLSKLAAK